MDFDISPETPDDVPDIDALMEDAFGPARFGRTVFRFREGRAHLSEFAFVARNTDGHMVASIRFWPTVLPDGVVAPMLGPLAVRPELRGLGIGKALIQKGLAVVEESGARAVTIVGDPGYYAPFGFSVSPVVNLDIGGPVVPLTFMGIEYQGGALSGLSGTLQPIPKV